MSSIRSIDIIQNSHLYAILVGLVCIIMIWMLRNNEDRSSVNQQETFNMIKSSISTKITEEIPTVGTSGMWIHMILHESHSNNDVHEKTIHAINNYIQKQKIDTSTSTNQVHVSLLMFEGQPIVYSTCTSLKCKAPHDMACIDMHKSSPYDRIPLHNVPALHYSTYQPEGWTNLYDAIGHTIQRIDQQLLQSSSIYERPAVLVVILTDGYENQSTYFTPRQIQLMIQQRREAGWKFIFLGANIIEAGNVAEDIGIPRSAAIKIDVADTSYSEALDQSTSSWRESTDKVQTYATLQPASMSSSSYARLMNSDVHVDFSEEARKQYERP